MSTIKFAQQGVRQLGWPQKEGIVVLMPGDIFNKVTSDAMSNEHLIIPKGTIGIFHIDETPFSISIIRDDCKAARKAIRLAEASAEELAGIANHKKDLLYKRSCKAELDQKISNGNLRLKALTKYCNPVSVV